MKILLTGSNGQVGHALTRSLQGLGEIVAVDRSRMDLADAQQIREVIQSVKPNLIVNAAAYTAVDKAESESDLAMRINAEAPAIIAKEAKKLGAAIIHYSTDYVFDGNKVGAYTEDDVPNPQNAYGRSKLAGELALRDSGVPYMILRTSWVYGNRGNNFLLTMQRLLQEREELRIVADQIGAPTWCRTIAEKTAEIIRQLQFQSGEKSDGIAEDVWQRYTGLYHLTAQGQTSWHGFAKAILAQMEFAQTAAARPPKLIPITTAEYPLPAKRPGNSVLSSQKLMTSFGALPQWDEDLLRCLSEAKSLPIKA